MKARPGDDKEDRAEAARGKRPSRAEEAREDRASKTVSGLVAKSKQGKGTITYTPRKGVK